MAPRHESLAAAELRWYWADATGEMGGLKSNFEAMRARMQLGVRPMGCLGVDIDERCLDAATREKRIRRALAQVPGREVVILASAFGPEAREIPAFGCATGVAPLTGVARRVWLASMTARSLEEWLARLVMRVHAGRGVDRLADAALLRAICVEAERMLQGALAAYSVCRYAELAARRSPGRMATRRRLRDVADDLAAPIGPSGATLDLRIAPPRGHSAPTSNRARDSRRWEGR